MNCKYFVKLTFVTVYMYNLHEAQFWSVQVLIRIVHFLVHNVQESYWNLNFDFMEKCTIELLELKWVSVLYFDKIFINRFFNNLMDKLSRILNLNEVDTLCKLFWNILYNNLSSFRLLHNDVCYYQVVFRFVSTFLTLKWNKITKSLLSKVCGRCTK